jgi:hypothetical protein
MPPPNPIRPRFFYDNWLLTTSPPIASSEDALIGSVQAEAAAEGTVEVSGPFTGNEDRDFSLRIILGGTSGVAQYVWSPDDELLSSSGSLLSTSLPTALQEGISVELSGEFEEEDVYRFKVVRPHGADKMLDGDRDTEYRSTDVTGTKTVDFDLGAALEPMVFALMDHNLTAGATLRLQASSSPSFGVLIADLVVPIPLDANGVPTGRLVYYIRDLVNGSLTAGYTARYWRISVLDAANTELILRWSEAYLGPWLEAPLIVGDEEAVDRPSPQSRMDSGRWSGL